MCILLDALYSFLKHSLCDFKKKCLLASTSSSVSCKGRVYLVCILYSCCWSNIIIELDTLEVDDNFLFITLLFQTSSGSYEVTLKYPHYLPCMNYLKYPESRKKLEKAFSRRWVESLKSERVNPLHKRWETESCP